MDLKSLRVQLDTVQIDTPQTLTLTNAVLALLDEVETLQQRMNDAWDAIEHTNPEAHMPEECQKHTCLYFTHYLAHGPADLTHEGYHAAEAKCEEWQQRAMDWYDAHATDRFLPGVGIPECPYDRQCAYWEKAVRA